ncbi:hypothetical protein K450DRAFT_302804 [Umbelopsis ramanniana AG]|uniref:Protein kinase domain-containing protein n=1 Tax=Umbelopsis ramanniana AG TaxID=1314678 RepID=A0AAD5E2Q9_UMBRA|nr:uncharacterized protein K450DRAFT_302804 [Umbelopsis ramanniana AG]KAI8576351.1 hypothetical protein K450DRAFT_302804 [Umbelopsis ramanniana AG]
MLPPCLGYDSSNNVYRFNVAVNGTTADIEKLTASSNIEWQKVLPAVNVPVSGQCYFDAHSYTFGIVAELTPSSDGAASALNGVFYRPTQNPANVSEVVYLPASNPATLSYQNNTNYFTSVDAGSNTQCVFSFEPLKSTMAYTCFNQTEDVASTTSTHKWLTFTLPTSTSSSGLRNAAKRQAVPVAAAASTTTINGAANGGAAVASTETPSPTTLAASSSTSQMSQEQPTSNPLAAANCGSQCQLNGVLVATNSHVLLIGWPNSQTVYYGNVDDAVSDATNTAGGLKFNLSPSNISSPFSPGTATAISDDTFAYLSYGSNPKLSFYSTSKEGSISTASSSFNLTSSGSNVSSANMLLIKRSTSNSSSVFKRDEPSSSWLLASTMGASGSLSVVATNPQSPSTVSTLNSGDPIPAWVGSPVNSPPVASSTGSSTNIGAVVGGVIGGVAFVVICIALLIFYRRRARHEKFSKGSSKSRGIQNEQYSDYIDERPGVHNNSPISMMKITPPRLTNGRYRQDTLESIMSPVQNTFSPVVSQSHSNTILPDVTQNYLQNSNINIHEYTGADKNDLQIDLKGGTHVLGDKYALTSEPATKITTYYTIRTANKLPDKMDQVSLHFFKEPALGLQVAQIGFATELAGSTIINHSESYKLTGGNGYAALSVTDACSPTKSLYRLIHPAAGDLTLADTTDQYFQFLTIKSLLQALEVLQRHKLAHTSLSTNAFFHIGGCVTEWKLGKLEECRVFGDYVGDCDVSETTPPEILNGIVSHISAESNLWSLGVVIYEIITGKPLFKSVNDATQFAKAGAPVHLHAITNSKSQMLLSCMLQTQPTQRSKVEDLLFIWDEDGAGRVDYADDDDLDSIEGY